MRENGRSVAFSEPTHVVTADPLVTEERLRAALEELDAAYDSTPANLCVIDREFRYLRLNAELARTNGAPAHAHIGRTIREMVPDFAEVGESVVREVFETGQPLRDVEMIGETDAVPGHKRVWLCNCSPLRSSDGQVIAVIIASREITAQRETEMALRASEERASLALKALGSVYEEAPVSLALLDRNLRYVRVSKAFAEQNGVPVQDHIGRSLHEINSSAADKIEQLARRVLASDERLRKFEIVEEGPSPGKPRVWLTNWFPLHSPSGEIIGVQYSSEEITERHAMERALRESEARFRLAIDGSPIAVFACDTDLRFTWVYNPQPPITDPDRFIGKRDDELVPGEPAGRGLTMAKRRVLESGVPERQEFVAEFSHTVLLYDYSLQPISDEAGKIVGVRGTATDITRLKRTEDERNRAQAELEAKIQELQTILDIAQIQIWKGDATCEKFVGNRLAYEHHSLPLGVNASFDAPTRELPEGYHVEVNGRVLESAEMPMQIAARTGKPIQRFEHDVVHADGRRMTIWANVAPVLNPDGSVRSVIGAYLDITELRKVEHALREADRRKDEFIATLAHELRNPLAAISSAAEIFNLKLSVQDSARQPVAIIKRQVNHMVRIIDDLLDVSRLNYGKLSVRKEKVDLADVLRSAIETSQPIVDRYRHRLKVTLPQQTIWVEADPIRLAQVISNLINNAASFMPIPGEILIKCWREEEHVVISVKDDGIGIDSNQRANLFEPFAQGASPPGRTGLGIGLALARGLVDLHGGSVEVNSNGDGKGSEFSVRLPIPEQTLQVIEPSTDDGSRPPRIRKRVLVVDDLADNSDTIALLVESMGHEACKANDGAEALRVGAEFKPEIILLDLGMPGLDGYQTCRLIRQQPWGKNITVVALSGWDREQDRLRTKESSFDHHLCKPVQVAVLAELFSEVRFFRRGTLT
jgi:PAS domain S-box-containing protein